MFHGGSSGETRTCNYCKKQGHRENNYWNKGKAQCYHCKKFGHVEKNCKLKNKENANYTEEENCDKEGVESTFYACQLAVEKEEDVWYVDSGCSNHMTRDESLFCKLDTTITTQITMGNDLVVKSKGKGTIVIASKKGIHDVLLVPDLA